MRQPCYCEADGLGWGAPGGGGRRTAGAAGRGPGGAGSGAGAHGARARSGAPGPLASPAGDAAVRRSARPPPARGESAARDGLQEGRAPGVGGAGPSWRAGPPQVPVAEPPGTPWNPTLDPSLGGEPAPRCDFKRRGGE